MDRVDLCSRASRIHVSHLFGPQQQRQPFIVFNNMMNNNGKSNDDLLVAAVEGGGTSFRVAVVNLTSGKILYETQISSVEDPAATLASCATFLRQHAPPSTGCYEALGVATFGPVGLDPSSPTFGCILNSSPKRVWRNVNVLQPLLDATRAPYYKLETDVNAPAWAEYLQERESGSNLSSLAYITVGTGVGVGLVVNHLPVHGQMHPEGGHVSVQPLPGDAFEGYSWGEKCPFFGKRTVEGLASSVALIERWQQRQQQGEAAAAASRHILADLPDDDDLWQHGANAIANLCATLFLVLSVERIVVGGGLFQRSCLLPLVHQRTVELINGYLESPNLDNVARIITTSRHFQQAGLNGAIVLAQTAYSQGVESSVATKSKKSVEWHKNMARYGIAAAALVVVGFLLGRSTSRR